MKRRRNRVAALVALGSLIAGGLAPVAGVADAAPAAAGPADVVPARIGIPDAGPELLSGALRLSVAAAAEGTWEMAAVLAAVDAGLISDCPRYWSCGTACTADLVGRLCVLSISWRTAARIGGVQIGPGFEVECYICECWYRYESSTGNWLFKRTTRGSCSGTFSGLILE